MLWARPHPKGNFMSTDEKQNFEENQNENDNNLSEEQSTLTETEPGETETEPGETDSQEEIEDQTIYYITQEVGTDYTEYLNQILGYTAFNMFFTFGIFVFFLISCIVNFLKGFF